MELARLRRLVLSAMVGLSLAVPGMVATTAPAAAATLEYAKLSISPSLERSGYYNVVVSGHFNNSRASSTVGMRLKGADVWFDDDLGVSVTGQAWAGDFALYTLVWHGTLNEDPEGGDEIYAHISSSTGWSRNTPEVSGHF
jgi:hypothetical protein